MDDQTYTDTAHLLRRAGFGAEPAAIKAAATAGINAAIDMLLHPETVPENLNDAQTLSRLAGLLPETRNGGTPVQAVKMWWVHRMLTSPRTLQEKMVLFWHGHFTSKDGGMQGDFLYRQNQLFRTYALGNFRTLTLAVSRDPEMLRYLNGSQNYKSHPNENYGRELMELYTCGIGPIARPNYTEDDVRAAARAFSGWNLRRGEFYFNPNQHDNDLKTFLGKTGNWNGDDIVDILVAHPSTAKRLCTQLWEFFAYPNPEPHVLDALTQTYYSSGYDIRAVMSRILHSQAFYSDQARLAVIKSPAQYVVGSIRMMGLTAAVEVALSDITPASEMADKTAGRKLAVLAQLPNAMRSMGQDLLAPPTVKGWNGGPAWINTSTLLARINFAGTLSGSRQMFGGTAASVTDYLQKNALTPESWVDLLIETLGPLPLSPATRQTLVRFVNGPDSLEGRLRAVIPMVMATPEYQVC